MTSTPASGGGDLDGDLEVGTNGIDDRDLAELTELERELSELDQALELLETDPD